MYGTLSESSQPSKRIKLKSSKCKYFQSQTLQMQAFRDHVWACYQTQLVGFICNCLQILIIGIGMLTFAYALGFGIVYLEKGHPLQSVDYLLNIPMSGVAAIFLLSIFCFFCIGAIWECKPCLSQLYHRIICYYQCFQREFQSNLKDRTDYQEL